MAPRVVRHRGLQHRREALDEAGRRGWRRRVDARRLEAPLHACRIHEPARERLARGEHTHHPARWREEPGAGEPGQHSVSCHEIERDHLVHSVRRVSVAAAGPSADREDDKVKGPSWSARLQRLHKALTAADGEEVGG
eukprot:1463696-Prymnesium_polylepis.3